MNGLAKMKPYMQIGGSAMYDVIIVGGGIIGCSIAWQLGKKGKKVLMLERGDTADGSAGATDGFVG